MSAEMVHPSGRIATASVNDLLPDLEKFYTDLHAHPELSMQETRTARLAADRLRAAGYDVTTGVGKTGVVGRSQRQISTKATRIDGNSRYRVGA